MTKNLGGRWLVLRTRSRDTLKLVEDLIRVGFDAWAPKRTFAKLEKGKVLTLSAPMLPSFAFAKANHVHALLVLAGDPVKSCPDFSVFHYNDRIPMVADGELHRMRQIEENDLRRLEVGKAKRRKPAFSFGENIRVPETAGAYAGMVGKVVRDDGKFIEIDLGLRDVKICAFLLERNNVSLAA